MTTRELGVLTGPLLIFGGPYSNLQATRALRREAERLGLAPQQVICTGDVLAYCGQPRETLALIRDWGIAVVQGNCEAALAAAAPDCGCGFDAGSACSLLSVAWYRYCLQQVDDADRRWMAALPEQIRFSFAGRRVLCVHGDTEQQNRFVFASSCAEDKQRQLLQSEADLILAGHSGIPFGQCWGNRGWLNAGVIGMPANDGTAEGWYMLLEAEADRIRARWQRLHYDVPPAQQAMRAAGLPAAYREALARGCWPSVDVLPQVEKAQTGQRLECPPLRF